MFIIETKLPESGPDCIAKLRQDPRGGFQAGQRQCTEIFQDQLSGPSDLSGDTRKHGLYLQQAREFAVSKIDKLGPAPLFLAQSVDAVAQSQQRAVDVGSFLHPLALVLSLLGDRTDRQKAHSSEWGCLRLGKMCSITGVKVWMAKQCLLQNQLESTGLNPTLRHRGPGRRMFIGKDDPALTSWFLKVSY